MKAAVFDKTGEPGEVLTMRNRPGPRQALVRVLLSPFHPSDLRMIPLLLRSVRARVIRPIYRSRAGATVGATLRPGLPHFAALSFLMASIAFWFLGSSCSDIS